jgi:hypothetical protein
MIAGRRRAALPSSSAVLESNRASARARAENPFSLLTPKSPAALELLTRHSPFAARRSSLAAPRSRVEWSLAALAGVAARGGPGPRPAGAARIGADPG